MTTDQQIRPPDRFVLRVRKPRCGNRECGSTELRVYGGHRQKDGSYLRYARCRVCGALHLVILQ